ncbi:MAG: 3-dehydroquinate synthase [Desulfobacterales bacterium]|nr:MAG: 3-dehydroquinate synthase [Desulfobacterales bacterium]
MKTLHINGRTGASRIVVGGRLADLGAFVPGDAPLFLITDARVRELYGDLFPEAAVIEIGAGEDHKTLDTMAQIYGELIAAEADRSSFIMAVGGGIVCDVAGFAASTYLRGVRFGFAPTTLLAQVDAGVGGKNGVNFRNYKNMVGTFNQPEIVLCDLAILNSLPRREFLCGMAEIVKHAAIADADLFAFLEKEAEAALEREEAVIHRLVEDSVVIKAGVVSRDERESGERRKLNFGHTYGHAVEKLAGIPHGQAVSIGMAVAADLSVRRGLLPQKEADRLHTLLIRLGLPVSLAELRLSETDSPPRIPDPETVLDAMRRDKKRSGGGIHFVLLNRLGEAIVTLISLTELEEISHGHAA